MTRLTKAFLASALLCAPAGPVHAVSAYPADARVPSAATDSADIVAVVAKFHTALPSGDSATVLALLAPDVMILESGSVETRDEYRSGHLRGDINFARSVQSTRTVTQVRVEGNIAWVVSTSVTQGQSGERQVNSSGAELMVLRKSGAGWLITAIHWSSRARR